jgi:integrase
VRRPGFEPGLPDWQSPLRQNTVNCAYEKPSFVQNEVLKKPAFATWLREIKHQQADVADRNATYVSTWLKSGKSAEDFVKSYDNAYTYNNYLFAVNHYLEFTGQPKLALRQKQCTPRNLIIAPKPEEIQRVVQEISDPHVRAYIALCATVGLRPKRLLKTTWQEIDFVNSWVTINEIHGKKVYRPNPLHADVARLLHELPKSSERIFDFTYRKVANALKAANTATRPNNCRDFFYNHARKSGADRDLVDWLAGHSLPGVRAHYLADEIKTEYAKFETAFTFSDVVASSACKP